MSKSRIKYLLVTVVSSKLKWNDDLIYFSFHIHEFNFINFYIKTRWLKKLSFGGLEPLRPSERIRIRRSAIIFETVIASDSGVYVCIANTTSGSDRFSIEVTVTKPLEVQVVPSVLTVDIGKSAELTCWTNRAFDLSPSSSSVSSSSSSSSQSSMNPTFTTITWRKDGVEIRPSLRMSFSPSGDKLRIVTVQREDKGIYQCFVKSEADMAQAAAELRLGGKYIVLFI